MDVGRTEKGRGYMRCLASIHYSDSLVYTAAAAITGFNELLNALQ